MKEIRMGLFFTRVNICNERYEIGNQYVYYNNTNELNWLILLVQFNMRRIIVINASGSNKSGIIIERERYWVVC